MSKTQEQSFVAYIVIMGAGVWYRGKTEESAIAGVKRQFRSDLGHLFKPKPGAVVTINLCDGTDRSVKMDESGFYDSDTGEKLKAWTVESPF